MQAKPSDSEPASPGAHVGRRHVFFVPGYDPIPPRRYRELYRREARRQAAISGYEIAMEGQTGGQANYAWNVWCRTDDHETESTIEFLAWEDIVRGSMNRSILSSYWVMAKTVFIYIVSGAFFRLVRLRPQPMMAALYPVLVLLAQLECALLAFAGVWWIATSLAGLSSLIGVLIGCAAFVAVMMFFFRKDRYIFAYYLINDYGFTCSHWGATPPALRARISAFAERLGEVADQDVDEVLIIGHSTGAHIAAQVLAEYLRARNGRPGARIAFMTLGQVMPMVSFLPRAQSLRADLNYLSQQREVAWIDISAPGDGGCFALSDPVCVSGVSPPEADKHWPKVVSAAYTKTLSPEVLAKTKWRFFRRHIQYLCAFDFPQDYDYFQITAGPTALQERFEWRGSTASRIETALSGYRDF